MDDLGVPLFSETPIYTHCIRCTIPKNYPPFSLGAPQLQRQLVTLKYVGIDKHGCYDHRGQLEGWEVRKVHGVDDSPFEIWGAAKLTAGQPTPLFHM